MANNNLTIAVGRRKTARAIAKLKEGKGEIKINKREISSYFPLFYQQEEVLKPLEVTGTKDKFDITIKAEGGGITGQIDAVKLAIARALTKFDPSLSSKLREFGLLTRDPRMPERKKYGQKKARKKFQWTKR